MTDSNQDKNQDNTPTNSQSNSDESKYNDNQEPRIAGYRSAKIELDQGKEYYWCSCGKSKNQPFCDGSHKGTNFTPIRFVAEESKLVSLCLCKHSKNKPFCDGAHRSLPQPTN